MNDISDKAGLVAAAAGTDITQRLDRIERRLDHLIEQVSALVAKVGRLHDAAPLETLQKSDGVSAVPED